MASPTKAKNPQEDYQIIGGVGSGYYEAVYKARKLRTNEWAAVKIIRNNTSMDLDHIMREVSILGVCRHPNIISYYDSYLHNDRLWIFMQLAGGGSLEDIYNVTGPLSEIQVAFICRETLRGLSYLHSLSIIHRDIKGANILLTDEGEVKLADLGVATKLEPATKRHTIVGTIYWMAPEVVAAEQNGYDHTCDIWSVGITAIELAESRPPLSGLSPIGFVSFLKHKGYKPPTLKRKENWSADFHVFLEHALSKNPSKRPNAKCMLRHPFFDRDMSEEVTIDLLNKYRDPAQNEVNVIGFESPHFDIPLEPIRTPLCARVGKHQQMADDLYSNRDVLSSDMKILHHNSMDQLVGIFNDLGKSLQQLGWGDADESQPGLITNTSPLPSTKYHKNRLTPPIVSNGSPFTSKDLMGACFSKVFNDYPLRIPCTASRIHSGTRDHHILLGTEEGISNLSMNKMRDAVINLTIMVAF